MIQALFYDHILTASQQEGRAIAPLLYDARAMGYGGVDVSFETLKASPHALSASLREADIAIASVYKLCRFETTFDKDRMQSFMDCVAQTGCDKVMIVPLFSSDNSHYDAERPAIIAALQATCELAKAYGLTVTVENFGRTSSPCCFFHDLTDILTQVPALGFTLDTGNFVFGDGVDPLYAFEVLKERIAHVHLKDQSRVLLTQGDKGSAALRGEMYYPAPVGAGFLPIGQILRALKKHGYNGYLSVEHAGVARQWNYISSSAQYLRRVLHEI